MAQVAKHQPLKNKPIYSNRSNIQLLCSFTYKEIFLGWLRIVEDDENPKRDKLSHPYELTTFFTQTHSDPSGKSCDVKKKQQNISCVLPRQTVKIEHFPCSTTPNRSN